LHKTCIIIAGPTAVGKTALAIRVAKALGTEIISADSRQCYLELDIGVARPSPVELGQVKHHFIASHSIAEEVSAATFETYALETAASIFKHRNTVVMVGGTGLYIKAFTEGLDDLPGIDPTIRSSIIAAYDQHGTEWLRDQLRQQDPLFYATGEMKNPQRMMRALEVMQSTGRSIRHFQTGQKQARPFHTIKIGLDLERAELYDRINQRVDQMMHQGLLKEVEGLTSWQHLNALQTVGYAELFDYLQGKTSLESAVSLIKQHTRHYAKRQLTWFRRDAEMHWFHPGDFDKIMNLLPGYDKFTES